MKKVLLVLLAAAGSIFTANAQVPIPNNGFEFWEDGGTTPANWDVISGTATRENQVTFTLQGGQQYIVRPHSGNYFLRLATDTFVRNDTPYIERGIMRTKFAYDLRPNFFAATLMHTPTSQNAAQERFAIFITLMKGADTVLDGFCWTPQESTIFPFTFKSWDISTLYRNNLTPDSAIVTLMSGATNAVGVGSSLWIDNMGFSATQPVGIVEKATKTLSMQNIAVSVYPNPMNTMTNIDYTLTEKANVKMVITDITGREVANLVNETQSAGKHKAQFDRNGLKAGVYIYRIQAGSQVQTGKIIIAD